MSDYDYYDSSASDDEDTYVAVWSIATNEREAVEAIADRIKEMQKLYRETIALASAFDVRVNFTLSSDENRGHNRDESIYWNPSSQNC